jgi:abortive infection bacteriophage resistance protein
MEVSDEPKASECLSRIGYYRLSAYWYSSRMSQVYQDPVDKKQKTRVLDTFRAGTKFSDAADFYVFDKKLRLLVLDALERIEVGIRTDIAILLGRTGAWAHRDKAHLHGNFTRPHVSAGRLTLLQTQQAAGKSLRDIAKSVGMKESAVKFALSQPAKAQLSDHDEWLARLDDKFQKSKEDFSKHFKEKYPHDLPPIWVAVELWDFGTLSHFFSGMTVVDRDSIAHRYGLPDGNTLAGWLRNLNDVRNFCAHHSRLWNRSMPFIPPWPPLGSVPQLDHVTNHARFYASAAILRHLLLTINPSSTWSTRFIEHVATLPPNPYVTLASAGFPVGWEAQPLWA